MRFPLLSVVVAASIFAPTASAQNRPNVAHARTRAASALQCLERAQSALRTHIQLLREAQEQLGDSHQDVRDDAARAVESLEQRIDDIGERIRACLPHTSHVETRVVVRDPTGAAANVGQENPATHVVERDAQLAPYVRVQVGERVDGHGTLQDAVVRTMVRRIANRLDQCYGELVERGALETGTAVLSFTVNTSGAVRRVLVEDVRIGSRRFRRCVQRAGQSLRAGAGANGGDATFAYTLHFGPSS